MACVTLFLTNILISDEQLKELADVFKRLDKSGFPASLARLGGDEVLTSCFNEKRTGQRKLRRKVQVLTSDIKIRVREGIYCFDNLSPNSRNEQD